MKSRTYALSLFLIFAAAILLQFPRRLVNSHVPPPADSRATTAQIRETYGTLPLYFIENQGQLDSRVAYYIQGGDKTIYFTGSGVMSARLYPPKPAFR